MLAFLLNLCCAVNADRKFDYLIIEGSGIAEPFPLAQTFAVAERDNENVMKYCRLDTLVRYIVFVLQLFQIELETIKQFIFFFF